VQNGTFIAGIRGVPVVGGAPVEVTSAGQLGIVMSSARYKHDIRDLGDGSGKLFKLRPVSFRYNNDPANTVQYGLVAEEVAKLYPELVAYGADGKPMTVRYSMLSAMLLNELQKQSRENARQAEQIRRLSTQVGETNISTDRRIAALETRHQQELRALQVAFEQRLSKVERATRSYAPVRVKF